MRKQMQKSEAESTQMKAFQQFELATHQLKMIKGGDGEEDPNIIGTEDVIDV